MNEDIYQDFALLVDGKNAFPVILDAIESAKTSLEINMFNWRDDKIGNLLAETVLKAADRGVKTTLSIDKYGSVLEHLEESRTSFFHKNAMLLRNAKILADQLHRRNSAKADDDFRLDTADLFLEIRKTVLRFARVGVAILRRTAFQNVGNIHLVAQNTHRFKVKI